MMRSRRSRSRPGPSRSHHQLRPRSEEHTSELQSQSNLVCRLLPEKNLLALTSTQSAPASFSNVAPLSILVGLMPPSVSTPTLLTDSQARTLLAHVESASARRSAL